MCTAISEVGITHLFGRTLDLEYSYAESTVLAPRAFELKFSCLGTVREHPAILGTAHVCDGYPLYFDAFNQAGLAAAALNFPGAAVYNKPREGAYNVASFELIPWILSRCTGVRDAVKLLEKANITDTSFSADMPTTPLHWLIADRYGCICVEPTELGTQIHADPLGVITNSPRFAYQKLNLSSYAHCSPRQPENHLCPDIDIPSPSRGMGAIGLPGDFSSESRFVRAVFCKTHTAHGQDATEEISRFFHVMDAVAQPKGCALTDGGEPIYTVYTSCADTLAQVYYYTTYGCRTVHAVDMKAHDTDGTSLSVFPREHKECFRFL